ncbi:MAG: PAS domain S-box protein [Gammaproteobacteria bacterium]|nr:PAS domain S-box protein [Gammaproteobacteria bacterium]
MNFKFGIREKLLVPLLFGLAVIIYVLFVIWQPSHLIKAKQQFIVSQTNLIKTLNPSIIQNILANDLAELHRVFENSQIIHQDKWRYITLNDPDNKQLYPIFSAKPEQTTTLIKIKHTIEENDEIFGYITLYTDWKNTKEKELKNINQLSTISILLFTIIAIFNFMLQTKWVYTPITKLKDITSQFSLNNYDIKLPAITSDEIGLLTHSIDHMRNKIKSTLDEITNKEKMTRAILETAPDAIITMDKKGIINSFNPGAENIFQYSSNEVIGQNIKILMPDDVSKHHDEYVTNFKKTASKIISKNRELNGMKKDGSLFPIEITINANIIDGKPLFTGVLRDITERRKVDRLKNEFIATVSHELRTPLTAIKGSLDIVTKGLNLELPEQAHNMLDVANRNVERLLSLINDILDIAKLESGEINFISEQFEIKPFIENCIELNQEYAKRHQTEFICTYCNNDIIVNVDKDRLTQVMSNLLSNAAKYSPENIQIEIFTRINKEMLRVSVKDYGPGIPEEFQPFLFEKFTQSSSGDTRQVGGTGLGLNISKMIIEKLGGTIGYKTIIDKETTFYFELPIVPHLSIDNDKTTKPQLMRL